MVKTVWLLDSAKPVRRRKGNVDVVTWLKTRVHRTSAHIELGKLYHPKHRSSCFGRVLVKTSDEWNWLWVQYITVARLEGWVLMTPMLPLSMSR